MNITWLGHSGFRIEVGDQILLVDPWLSGNPMFPDARRAEAIRGATQILISHGHFDHLSDVVGIAKDLQIPVVGIFDLVTWLERSQGVAGVGFNKGGTVRLGEVRVTMVHAVHSSSMGSEGGPIYTGSEAGFMIEHGGRTLYFSGDTDVMADMGVFEALHHPVNPGHIAVGHVVGPDDAVVPGFFDEFDFIAAGVADADLSKLRQVINAPHHRGMVERGVFV